MKTFNSYNQAFEHARQLATACRRDVGIYKTREFSAMVFQVFLLPNPENRTGRELLCEAIAPETPASN